MHDSNPQLHHDDGRDLPTDEPRIEQPAPEAPPIGRYDTQGAGYDDSVYGADEPAGFRCDVSRCDTAGHDHELSE